MFSVNLKYMTFSWLKILFKWCLLFLWKYAHVVFLIFHNYVSMRSKATTCTVLHMFTQVLFWAGNQDNHQDFDPFLLKVAFFQKVQFVFQISKSQKKYSKKISWAWNLNFDLSLLLKKLWLIFMGMKQILFCENIVQNGRLQKTEIFKTTNSQNF